MNVGNSIKYNFPKETIVINNPKNILQSANKRLARMRFKARGIPAPMLWLSVKEIPIPEYPVIGRTTYHMKAQGFWFCNTPQEATRAMKQGATHFLKFIKNTREFRAHVFSTVLNPKSSNDYSIGKLSEKRGGVNITGTTIKNHDNGYLFISPMKTDLMVLDQVRYLAKKTMAKFKLHYGGVDIIYSLDNKKAMVLEINTTPCLTDQNSTTIEVYANQILKLLGRNIYG